MSDVVAPAVPVSELRPTETAVVFDHVITRVAGVPAETLDRLRLPSLARAAEVETAEDRAAGLATELSSVLFDLVPSLDDRRLRRAALSLRRDIHNGRARSTGAALPDGLADRLGPSAPLLARWADASAEAERLGEAVATSFAAELSAAGEAVLDVAADPSFRAALAIASPTLSDELGQSGPTSPRRERLIRALASYVVRAATKTAPFSHFATVRLDRTQGVAASQPARSVTTVVLALASEVLRACASSPELGAAFDLRRNTSLREGTDGQLLLLVPMYQHIDEQFFWRRDDVLDAQHSAWLLLPLASLDRAKAGQYQEMLPVPAPELVSRLVDICGLVPEAPWSLSERQPLAAVAARLEALPSSAAPSAASIATRLRSIVSSVEQVGDAGAQERRRLATQVRDDAADLLRELGTIAAPWLHERALLYEEVSSPLPAAALGPAVGEDLQDLARFVRPHLMRSHLYDEVRAHFLDRFGWGGRCTDVMEFAMSFTIGGDAIARFQRTALMDQTSAATGGAGSRPVASGPGTSGPAALAMFQVAADDEADLRSGDHLLVLNSVAPASLGMFARYRQLLGPELDTGLRVWAEASFGGAEVLELPVALDVNGLQRQSAGLLRPVAWPTEPSMLAPDAVGLEELVLAHQPDEDRLVVTRLDGRPVALAYTGVVPTTLISGPVRHLLAVSDPWTLELRPAERPAESPIPNPPPSDVVAVPRSTLGRVVVGRAHWRMPADRFPRRGAGELPMSFHRRLDRWRRSHGMPDEVYVRVERRRRGFTQNPKPLWLAFDSPFAVSAVERVIDADAVTVIVAEALPASGECWQRDGAGQRRATEHAVLLRWDASEALIP